MGVALTGGGQRLELPADLVAGADPRACVLYVCRLRVGAHGHYPLAYRGEERWVGAAVNLRQVRAGGRARTGGRAAKAAAKAGLLDGTAWEVDD